MCAAAPRPAPLDVSSSTATRAENWRIWWTSRGTPTASCPPRSCTKPPMLKTAPATAILGTQRPSPGTRATQRRRPPIPNAKASRRRVCRAAPAKPSAGCKIVARWTASAASQNGAGAPAPPTRQGAHLVKLHVGLRAPRDDAAEGIEQNPGRPVQGQLMHLVEGPVHQAGNIALDEEVATDQMAHQIADGGVVAQRHQGAKVAIVPGQQRLTGQAAFDLL